MNSRQLRRYADQLRSFNENHGYVRGLDGAPISRSAAEYYRKLERQNNRISEGYEQAVGGVIVPGLGQDIASQIDRRDRQRFVAGGEQATFQKINRDFGDISGQDSINRLIEGLRKKTRPQYLTERISNIRHTIETMLEQSNDQDSVRAIRLLSDEQLNILVDYTPFMNAASGRYEFQKAMNADETYSPENWMTDIFETNLDEVHSLIDWAHTLDPNEPVNRDDIDSPTTDPNRRRRIVPRKRKRS